MVDKIYEIYNKNKDIKYGWKDKNGNICSHINNEYVKQFHFQSTEKIKKSKIGNCWETVELTREELEKNNIPCNAYFFVIPYGKFYCHSIIVATVNNSFYWIENSFVKFKGVHKYNSLESLFKDVLDNFDSIVCNNNFNISDIKIYNYNKPKENINCIQFYFHCFKNKNITQKYLNQYIKSIEVENK